MEPSRRVRVGLALHALGGAFLFVRDAEAFAAMAFVVAAGSAVRADSILKRVAAVGAGALLAALIMTVSRRMLVDLGHVFLLLALAVSACIDAAGTSFREGRTRWLWLRALLLALTTVIALGVWPAPHPSTWVPALLVSHVLLRLGTPPLHGPPLSLRPLIAMIAATFACLGLSEVTDVRFEPATFDALKDMDSFGRTLTRAIVWAVPQAPFASMALAFAFAAASLRIAPRAGVDGAVAAAMALAFALQVDMHTWFTAKLGIAVVACLVATSTASRHIALRVFAGASVLAGVWLSEHNGSTPMKVVVIASAIFVGIGALVAARPAAARALPADPTYARLGALLHMAALALTVFMPTASLVALVPAVVFATKPLARFGTLALVTMAWATAPMLAELQGFTGGAALAMHGWAPWIMLALLEAARSRGQPVLVARLGVTVGALFFSLAEGSNLDDSASLVFAFLPGAVVVQAVFERAVGTVRPLPRVEPLAVVVALPVLAGLAVFEFVMRWLVSKDGFYPYWDLHPVTLFLIDGAPALVCVWLVAQAGLRRALPFLAPGGAMLAAIGAAFFAQALSVEHELAAVGVGLFCAGAVTRPPLARIGGVWCAIAAGMVVTLRGSLPSPDVIAEVGYPLWVLFWFGALVAALVLSDAMRAAPLLPAALERAREPVMMPRG